LLCNYALSNDKFIFRSTFSDVPVIELKELKAQYDLVTIIDVRSLQECNVIKINKAHCIPWSNVGFNAYLNKYKAKKSTTPLIMYCNGYTCKKSYRATRFAMKLGVKNVFAFDAGILDWAKSYPELTTLIGETPLQSNDLISKEMLSAKFINFERLLTLVEEKDKIILIDIREKRQISKSNIRLDRLDFRNISFKNMVKNVIRNGKYKDEMIVVVDAVGKQVRWIQYYFEKYKYDNYYFLKNGASNKSLLNYLIENKALRPKDN
jgi:rhodanese-related sulfurtransferase